MSKTDQQEKLQVVEHNSVRRICRVKGEYRTKMEELREEMGMQKRSLKQGTYKNG